MFSEGTLKGLFELNDGGWLNFYMKGDRYSRAKLNADLETLRAYYQNRGYLEFEVESTQVAISPDKQDITITINVKEGQLYTVTGVKLEGDYLGKEDEFRTLVTIKPGRAVSRRGGGRRPRAPSSTASAPSATPSRRSTPGPRSTAPTAASSLTLVAEPQRRVYVRRVNVAGNTRTRDEVIRREFRQFESSWYDGAQDQALARPRRPPRLLHRGQRRHAPRSPARWTRST